MKYAEVAVNAVGGHWHTFTYSIPQSLEVMVGQEVSIPFGARNVNGIVVSLSDQSSIEITRDIIGVTSPHPLISAERIRLAQWISGHYMCPLFAAIALMLPPGFGRNLEIKHKYIRYLSLDQPEDKIMETIAALKEGRSFKQAAVLQLLIGEGGRLPASYIQSKAGCVSSVITALRQKGLIIEEREQVWRDPLVKRGLRLGLPLAFTDGQQAVWQLIKRSINNAGVNGKADIFLLHGVTGSGKTEIYLQALAETISKGRKGICLVPEIALTPQTIDRFFSRFPGRVAVMHSKLTRGEQYDEWSRIEAGDFDVVIGPRSAVFSPQPDLGLIIVDEEHEWAYKQTEQMPRYHARDVAVELARLTGSTLIMGSATPDVDSYFRAGRGEFKLIELKDRVTPLGASSLPEVAVINMRDEYKAGNRGIFSRRLKSGIGSSLQRNEQVILFVNRRGSSTFIQCRNCGYVPSCKQCTGTLTYHASNNKLICHHCRRKYIAITACPVCHGQDMQYMGIGTESVEVECKKLFPRASIIRLDSDAVTQVRDYEKTIAAFYSRAASILIGTQMVAKGLDFPGVSLVGIVNADTNLSLPDFRAGERTFQLLCQVEGRAGRGIAAGLAIVQTFNPAFYAIKYAAGHDYNGFYQTEIKYRRRLGYPPFSSMVRMVYVHSNYEKCRAESNRMAQKINTEMAVTGVINIKVIGPAPAFIQRLRGKYQMQLILLGHDIHLLLDRIDLPRGWIVDVDPVGMV